MATSDAPISVNRVVLTVRDLDRVGDFYQQALGLGRLGGDGEVLSLGAGDRPLLELRRDRAAEYRPNEAGLFHTAFLMPDRAALGRWLAHHAGRQGRLDGASDHLVSEALYLHDPEGNGIEIYVDRPRATWAWDSGEVVMDTRRLNLNDLLAAGTGDWTGAPEDMVIGHVHLQVGDLTKAADFYVDRLGFDLVARAPGGLFYSTGGYHHHLATNIWNSRGAGVRPPHSTGLAGVELLATPEAAAGLGQGGFDDPWNNRITIVTQ